MRKILLLIFICLMAVNTRGQDMQKTRIIANVYAILVDGANDFQKYMGMELADDDRETSYKVKKNIFANNDIFSVNIVFYKKINLYQVSIKSQAEEGENIYKIVEEAMDNLVDQNIVTKSIYRTGPRNRQKISEYFDINKNKIASFWYDSLRHQDVYINSNKTIQPQLQKYISFTKININNIQPIVTPPKALVKISDPIIFNDYFLFYQTLINTSDLGFDWIFNTKNPDSLEIKFVYIYPNSPFTKAEDFEINNNVATIVKIDGVPAAKIARQEAINLMNGKPGTNCEIVLRIKKNGIDFLMPETIKKEAYVSFAKSNYEKGIAAFRKANIDDAIHYFSDYTYPPSQIVLFKIYSGRILDEISFTNKEDATAYNKLRNLINTDSVKKYSENKNDNPGITALLSLYCHRYRFNTPNLTSAKNILTKKAADDGDVWAQELMTYLHAGHFSDDDLLSKDILPDKQQAMYWYKRAIAGGSKDGEEMLRAIGKMKTSKDVYGADRGRNCSFTFKDAKAVTKVAHINHGLMGIIQDYISPFGVNGFEEGVVYTVEKSHLPFTWSTHIIRDKEFAFKNYDDAFYVFKNEFSKDDIKDVQWLYSPEQEGAILKNNAAVFTAIENDGRSYKMRMMLYLVEINGGYQINLQYGERK